MVLLAAGALLLIGISRDGSYFGDLFLGMLVFGPGLGAGTVAGSIAALTGVPEQDAGVASGTNTGSFQIGGALGSAIATTVAASHGGIATTGRQAASVACVIAAPAGLLAAMLLRRPNRAALAS
jgi:predicted MFS family arabinose efflux permease